MAKIRKSSGPAYRSKQVSENEIVVSGRDLVVPTPQTLPAGPSDVSIFQSVPGNPIYWTGTRVSKLASQYQLFKPIRFEVIYHPQVAVTNPGLVVYGTLFQDSTADRTQLQQVLNTSNGGGISECYTPFRSVVNTRVLQMKSYNCCGPASDTANSPFIWVATYSGYAAGAATASSTPGWVEVCWTYKFMTGNPGSGNSGEGIYVADGEMVQRYNRRRDIRGLNAINWTKPFGIPLGLLKDVGRPLLKHVSVMLLNGAQTGTVRYGVGKVLTWIGDNLLSRRNADETAVRDDDGTEIELPDDTPVIVMMSGLPQPAESEPTGYVEFDPLVVVFMTEEGLYHHASFNGPGSTEVGGFEVTIGNNGDRDSGYVTAEVVIVDDPGEGRISAVSLHAGSAQGTMLARTTGQYNEAVLSWVKDGSRFLWTAISE